MADKRNDTELLDRVKLQKPPKYKVLLHNDDFTPMDLVQQILMHVFRHSSAAATRIMLTGHNTGICVAGIYTHEIAETKAAHAMQIAEKLECPLQATIEKE